MLFTDDHISPAVGEFAMQQIPPLYAEIDRLRAAVRDINHTIYRGGAPAGSANYARIREACCRVLYPATGYTVVTKEMLDQATHEPRPI